MFNQNISKLKDKHGNLATNREEILAIFESFYSELYKEYENNTITSTNPWVLNQGSEEIPEITIGGFKKGLKEMKNNKSPGEDGLHIDSIKIDGKKQESKLDSDRSKAPTIIYKRYSPMEKLVEYNKLLILVFVDYEKAFDSIDQKKMIKALIDCQMDSRYCTLT